MLQHGLHGSSADFAPLEAAIRALLTPVSGELVLVNITVRSRHNGLQEVFSYSTIFSIWFSPSLPLRSVIGWSRRTMVWSCWRNERLLKLNGQWRQQMQKAGGGAAALAGLSSGSASLGTRLEVSPSNSSTLASYPPDFFAACQG